MLLVLKSLVLSFASGQNGLPSLNPDHFPRQGRGSRVVPHHRVFSPRLAEVTFVICWEPSGTFFIQLKGSPY
jgi:hypothetical protein